MNLVEARNLTKEFKTYKSREGLLGAFRDLFTRNYQIIRAVDNINLTIQQGEMVGYIGENGAGKSTTIKMLTGILVPTSGELRVNGMVPYRERERFVRTIGVVFGQRSQLWWDIAVQESFRLLKKVYRVSDEEYERHVKRMIEILEIGSILDKPVRKLSLGQRMRAELVAALIHKPPLLFLDEPTIGLDVLAKLRIREFLKEMNETYGTTILLTTHDLSDIEALCPRVVILDSGKIIYDGALQDLKRTWGEGKRVTFEFAQPMTLERVKAMTGPLPVSWHERDPFHYTAAIRNGDLALSELISAVVTRQEVKDIQIEETSTEEIIRKIYEEGALQHGHVS